MAKDTIDQAMEEKGATVWENGQQVTQEAEPNQQPEQDTNEQNSQQGQPSQQEPSQQEQPSGEQQGEQGEGEQKSEEQQKIDWLSKFNETFQTNYESQDQVKELFDYKNKYSDLQQTVQQKDEALSQASDPSSYFANENVMKINEVVKQHNVDPATASRVLNTDFSQMNSEDVLVMNRLMEEPEWQGKEDLLREEIQEQYNLDMNPDDYDDENEQKKAQKKLARGKEKLNIDARKAKDQLTKMQQVELPGKQDLEGSVKEQKQQLEQSAQSKADNLVQDLEKINYHEDMEFQIDEDWKNKNLTKDNIVQQATSYGFDLSDEQSYEKFKNFMRNRYILENLPKLFNDYKKRLQTQQKDEEFNKYSNPRENNRQEKPDNAPKPKSREAVQEEMAKDFGVKQ